MFVGFVMQEISNGIIEIIGVYELLDIFVVEDARVGGEISESIAFIGVNVTSVVWTHTTPGDRPPLAASVACWKSSYGVIW
jgi:hypothetical protein